MSPSTFPTGHATIPEMRSRRVASPEEPSVDLPCARSAGFDLAVKRIEAFEGAEDPKLGQNAANSAHSVALRYKAAVRLCLDLELDSSYLVQEIYEAITAETLRGLFR